MASRIAFLFMREIVEHDPSTGALVLRVLEELQAEDDSPITQSMHPQVDIDADLNAQDDEGLGWATLADARHPERVRPGAMLLAGDAQAQAVVRVVAVDTDGQVHFAVLPGSIASNRHLLGQIVS